MSDDRLFERNAQTWLEVGPTTAPKRVVDAALLAIETTPQQRGLPAPWRPPHLTFYARFAVAAAVGLLVVGAGVLILRNPQNQIGSPSPSPTASASPISLEALQGTWASVGTRDDPTGHHANPPQLEAMAVDAAGLRINTFKGDANSSMSIAGGQLTLRMDAPQDMLTRQSWDCTTGDTGMYNASLSTDGQTLTLTPVGDQCATRSDILTGDWTLWSCPTAAQYAYCDHVSELAPGRYVSTVFRPFSGGTSGQLAYTVPTGWAKLSQPPTWPDPGSASWAWITRVDAPSMSQGISIYSNLQLSEVVAVSASPTPTCPPGAHEPSGTATQIVDFLESLPYLSVTGRTPVTIGGLAGIQIDLSMREHFVDPCSSYTNAIGQVIYSGDIALFQNNNPDQFAIYLNYDGDASARLILLDTANGREVIAVTAPDAASLEARVAEAMPVIQSFEFLP